MIDNIKNAGFKVTVRHGPYTRDYDKVEDLAADHNGEVVDSGNDGKRLDYSEVYFRGESDSFDFIQSALREGLQPTKSFRAASSVGVVLTHSAKRVASLHAAPKYASNDLTTECKYWAEHFARKFGAGHSITQTRRGGCKINWNENWGGYSIEGNEIGSVIVWTSGREKAANLPREIEKLVTKSRAEAQSMFNEETKDWAREVAYRYSSKQSVVERHLKKVVEE